MDPGRRNRMVSFRRQGDGRDTYGGKQGSWADIGSEWAEIIYGRGEERRAAAQTQQVQTATLRLAANSFTASLTERDAATFDGADWDIKSNVPLGRDGREVTVISQR